MSAWLEKLKSSVGDITHSLRKGVRLYSASVQYTLSRSNTFVFISSSRKIKISTITEQSSSKQHVVIGINSLEIGPFFLFKKNKKNNKNNKLRSKCTFMFLEERKSLRWKFSARRLLPRRDEEAFERDLRMVLVDFKMEIPENRQWLWPWSEIDLNNNRKLYFKS